MAESCLRECQAAEFGDLRLWRDVAKDESAPFVHLFRTNRQTYAYDVNTRRILRVSPVVWDVLAMYGRAGNRRAIEDLAGSHGRPQVTAAIEEIESARGQGLLLSIRPHQVVAPDLGHIRHLLAEKREQLILNVTEDCNFRCSYCLYGGTHEHYRAHSAKMMSWEVAHRAIEEFLACSRLTETPTISFYGGEPLLNLRLIRRCVAHVRRYHPDRNVRFSLTTNGSLLVGRAAEFLAGEGFLVVVSLDGPEAVHDRCRRTKTGEPTWRRVLSNVRRFLAAFPDYRSNGRLRFNAVATPEVDLCEAERFWASCEAFTDTMGLEVTEQKIPEAPMTLRASDPMATSARALHEAFVTGHISGQFAEEYDQVSRWVQTSMFQKRLLVFHKRGYLSPHLPEEMVLLNMCVPGVRRTFVSAEGEYYACERVVHSPAQRIGDVVSGVDADKVFALLERWVSATSRECRFCWCVSHCMAGCLAMLHGDGSITEEAKGRLCATHRRAMHRMLIEYCGILEENPNAFGYMAEFALT